jgi:hypothetical protein
MAQRAVKGDYFITGEEIAKQRRRDVPMNTEIKHAMTEQGLLGKVIGIKAKAKIKTKASLKAKK